MQQVENDQERERIGNEAYERATALGRLSVSIDELIDRVEGLHEEVQRLPRHDEVERKVDYAAASAVYRRRVSILALVAFFIAGMWAYDAHIEACSPGSRTESGINYVAETPADEFDRARMQQLLQGDSPAHCDVVVPINHHDEPDEWPTTDNYIGFLLYGLILAGAFMWLRSPINVKHEQIPPPPIRKQDKQLQVAVLNGNSERRGDRKGRRLDDYKSEDTGPMERGTDMSEESLPASFEILDFVPTEHEAPEGTEQDCAGIGDDDE